MKDQVNSDNVIKKINSGENVYYEDVEIVGDLDFTQVLDTAKEGKNSYRSYIGLCYYFHKLHF
jgi:hypothetical protein